MRQRFILAGILALVGLAHVSFAQPAASPAQDPRIDPATGRFRATWPKDRLFDHHHMKLELSFPDMGKAELEGLETLTISPIGTARSSIDLDCQGPIAQQVTLNGSPCTFEHKGNKLSIRFPRELPRDSKADLVIRYSADFSKAKGEGLTYSKAKPDASSLTSQSPQIHSQGEAELNSRWFPCLDHPSEKLSTELLVTVEDGFDVLSNGRLLSKSPASEGRTKWHWSQDKPHTSYLVALVIGKFAQVEVGGPESARPGLAMPVYTPHGTEDNVKQTFKDTARMMAFFEDRFGVKYPWAQYAQAICRDFAAGGMENTACTILTLYTSAELPDGAMDDLISHELAHQWFGDLVTCKSWDHLWINEGWATFSEALWAEHEASDKGPDAARKAYHRSILSNYRAQRSRNHTTAPVHASIVSNRFDDPDSVFQKSDDPYSKGAMILHMLRLRLGDEAFFKGGQLFLERFSYKSAETDDFRRVMEEVSGQSLERFFNQWCLRPGLPRLSVEQEWDDATSTLTIAIEQTQQIDALNPAYAISVPVLVKTEEDSHWVYLDMDTRQANTSIKLPSKPKQVSVDPNLTILAGITVDKPLAMWIDEATQGETLSLRINAIEHLATLSDAAAKDTLAAIAADPCADAMLHAAASQTHATR